MFSTDSSLDGIGVATYSVSAALFFLLTGLVASGWQRTLQGGLLILASATSTLWAASHAFAIANPSLELSLYVLPVADVLRNGAWYAFLLKALGFRGTGARGQSEVVRLMALGAMALTLLLAALAPFSSATSAEAGGVSTLLLIGNLLLAVAGLLLVEQLYRNAAAQYKWGLKFLSIGIGGMFAYDFYLYADALLFNRISPVLEYARGGVAAFVVPLVALSVARVPQWSVSVFVSRHVVFHSATLVGAGVYLLVMAAAGYYIREQGGDWGPVLQVLFLFGAGVVLAALLFSGKLRSEVKVFINKHFYKNKYDYRQEWLRFTDLLARPHDPRELRLQVLQALGQIVKSNQGTLWVRGHADGIYEPREAWNVRLIESAREPATGAVGRFLCNRNWVINLEEYAETPELYGDLILPDWLSSLEWAWLVVPLMQQEQLVGFVVLGRTNARLGFNWEDSDLLKMVGRHAASHLAWVEANEALAQARQFEAFNRLSAYVVHDLKNLAGQLSLVVSNAKRHMGNPEFMADAVDTVDNAVKKMNRLLAQLRKDRAQVGERKVVELDRLVRDVVNASSGRRPVPTVVVGNFGLIAYADPDRFSSVLQHLIQNAQEATPDEGKIELRLHRDGDWAELEIEDTGCGMDGSFVRDRLFRPFDTTKGNAGMGVGVFESREYVRSHGGELSVTSQPNKGTTFTARMPLHRRPQTASTVDGEKPLRAAN